MEILFVRKMNLWDCVRIGSHDVYFDFEVLHLKNERARMGLYETRGKMKHEFYFLMKQS
jgi:hypothetical protein